MYDKNEYLRFINYISKKYRHVSLSLKATNLDCGCSTTIIGNSKNKLDRYEIVFDPTSKSSSKNHPDAYYCQTFEDFKEILIWIFKNKKIYITKIKNDVMDLDNIDSYNE